MTSRVLPRVEWTRLQGTEMERIAATALAQDVECYIFVVEDDSGAIIGCWCVFQAWHAEGIWIAPQHRKRAGVARRLLKMASLIAQQLGFSSVMTAAQTDEVATLLDSAGARALPGLHFVMPLRKGEETCRPQSRFH